GLHRPSVAMLAAAVLAGVSLWPLAYELEVALIAPNRLQTIVDLVKPLKEELDRTPFAIKLFALAICPAICEELFFRGFLLQAFSARLRPTAAIVLTAALFGLFHVLVRDALLLERFPPTAVLGLVLGWLAYRSGSLWPGMLLHAIHNTTVLALPKLSPFLGEWTQGLENHTHLPWWIPAASLIPLTLAAVLIGSASKAKRD
ncbi:MAG TPA: CPBP family intramembrane glutamic endopeptidase, partial [Planctomycetaceae bacterium]|nr:CPBP family intramembrane glutamic endopeptidase [Planctomycetaceae bacterium]